jgi:hypothetical protein
VLGNSWTELSGAQPYRSSRQPFIAPEARRQQ